jgi:hypothetical protein
MPADTVSHQHVDLVVRASSSENRRGRRYHHLRSGEQAIGPSIRAGTERLRGFEDVRSLLRSLVPAKT